MPIIYSIIIRPNDTSRLVITSQFVAIVQFLRATSTRGRDSNVRRYGILKNYSSRRCCTALVPTRHNSWVFSIDSGQLMLYLRSFASHYRQLKRKVSGSTYKILESWRLAARRRKSIRYLKFWSLCRDTLRWFYIHF